MKLSLVSIQETQSFTYITSVSSVSLHTHTLIAIHSIHTGSVILTWTRLTFINIYKRGQSCKVTFKKYEGTVNSSYTVTVNSSYTVTVNSSYTATVNSSYTVTVNLSYTVTVNSSYTVTVYICHSAPCICFQRVSIGFEFILMLYIPVAHV